MNMITDHIKLIFLLNMASLITIRTFRGTDFLAAFSEFILFGVNKHE